MDQEPFPYDSGSQGAVSVAAADVNLDGKPDLLGANGCFASETVRAAMSTATIHCVAERVRARSGRNVHGENNLTARGGRMKSRISYTFRSSLRQLGPLEERMLEKLLTRRSATVRELYEDGDKDLAYTTVMTTLDRLFRKGLLKRSKEGRAFRYRPRFSREELYREAASQALRLLLRARQ